MVVSIWEIVLSNVGEEVANLRQRRSRGEIDLGIFYDKLTALILKEKLLGTVGLYVDAAATMGCSENATTIKGGHLKSKGTKTC